MASSNLPLRQSNSRHHNHSVSVGSISQTHRVTRRKSMSSNSGTNMAAVAAAVKDATESDLALPVLSNRRSMTLKSSTAASKASEPSPTAARPELGNHPSFPGSLPNHAKTASNATRTHPTVEHGSAIAEGPEPSSPSETANGTSTKSRMRRASEGSHLVKTDGKRMSGGELRCDKCGKGYKHSSCLTKHLLVSRPHSPFSEPFGTAV